MKDHPSFRIYASAWLSAVRCAARAVIPKPVLPDLENIRVSLNDKNDLLFEAGDTETWISVSRQVIEGSWRGAFLMPARLCAGPFADLGNTVLSFSVAEESHVAVEWEGGMVTIPILSDGGWPGVPSLEKVENAAALSGADVVTAIPLTEYAAAKDEIRPVLQGLLFDFLGAGAGTCIVGSDAHRLVATTVPEGGSQKAFSVNIPRRSVQVVKALSSASYPVSLRTDGRHAAIVLRADDQLTVTARLIEGTFPAWRSVLPAGAPHTASVALAELSPALDRAAACAGDNGSVRLSFSPGRLTLTAQDLGFQTYAEMDVSCDYDDEPMTIAIRAKLLLDAIEKVPWRRVRFEFSDPSRAVVLRDEEEDTEKLHTMSLLMPVMAS